MMGRYKVMTGEFADLMLGYYGATIGRRDPAVIELAAQQAKKDPIDMRPADLLKPEWQELRVGRPGAEGLQRLRRGRADLRHVPAGGAEVLRHSRTGPEESGQGSRTRKAGARAARCAPAGGNGKGPVPHHHARTTSS